MSARRQRQMCIRDRNNSYIWEAKNFPLDELELSIRNNQFDRIKGIINGSGLISSDQYYFDGRLAWSLGKYRNIELDNSLFDFSFENNIFNISLPYFSDPYSFEVRIINIKLY